MTKFNYRIQYTGAPYGDNEEGHTVSRHRTLEAARRHFDKLFDGTTGIYNNQIQTIDGERVEAWQD